MSLLSGEKGYVNRAARFRKQCEKEKPGKERLRQLEMEMLGPDPMKPFIGGVGKKTLSNLKKWSVQLVLGSDENYELFSKFFKINQYQGANVNYKQLVLLFSFLRAMERGNLSFDSVTNVLYYCKGKVKVEI